MSRTTGSSVYTAINSMTHGELRKYLIAQREAGLSYERIARGVRDQFDIEIGRDGCYNWFRTHLPEHMDKPPAKA